MSGHVLCNGDGTDSFNISSGVKQGCVIAPILFNLFFSQALLHTMKGLDMGEYDKYRSDGSAFDCLSTPTMTAEKLTIEVLFADDCATMAHKENHLQTIADHFAEASRFFELTISLGKTELLVQAAPNIIRPQPIINIEGVRLKCVESFKYPCSTDAIDGSPDGKISSSRRHQTVDKAHGLQGCSCLHTTLWV